MPSHATSLSPSPGLFAVTFLCVCMCAFTAAASLGHTCSEGILLFPCCRVCPRAASRRHGQLSGEYRLEAGLCIFGSFLPSFSLAFRPSPHRCRPSRGAVSQLPGLSLVFFDFTFGLDLRRAPFSVFLSFPPSKEMGMFPPAS